MKVRLSVITKVMGIVILMMLTVTVAISLVLIVQSKTSIEEQHRRFQLQNQHQLTLMGDMLSMRSLVWVETLSNNQSVHESDLVDIISRSQSTLILSLQLEKLWLFSANSRVLVGQENGLPEVVQELEKATRLQMRPQQQYLCTTTCLRYLSAPILVENGDVAVLVMGSDFSELLATLSQTADAYKIAVVKETKQANNRSEFTVISPLSASNLATVKALLSGVSAHGTIREMVNKGVRVRMGSRYLLVSLLLMPESKPSQNYILFVRDITTAVQSLATYQNWVVGSAISLFLIFTAFLLFVMRQYRRKLVHLYERLPLLAEHRYQEFAHLSARAGNWHNTRFPDELDVLEKTASNLAKQLEQKDSEIAASQVQLENMAMFDGLTNLPNRNMLTFQIEKHIAATIRDKTLATVLFLDLDDFKKVNDSYGHDAGDKLLKAAASRIVYSTRDSDIVARFGGDEFVVLLTNVYNREQVERVATKLIDAFSAPIKIDHLQFYISVSIGIAITTQPETLPLELLRHADIAMYEAKAKQGAAFRLYDASMNVKVMRKVELENEARVALRENQFSLALQPQLDLKTFKLEGFEALIRWHHPLKGTISPGEFIPILESTPFMLELDYWVLTHSLRLLRELHTNGYPEVRIAINLSAPQFADPALPEFLSQQLKLNSLPPDKVELELTETSMMSNVHLAADVCKALRKMGCLVAIDDFGTGYSSLSYLKTLPVDIVKIDRSFTMGMLENPEDKSIVQSTITLVGKLGRTVIAEGVETAEQMALLREFQCHQAQGYFISRPICEEALWQTLSSQVKGGRWMAMVKEDGNVPQHQFKF